jgi:hypothetical protein
MANKIIRDPYQRANWLTDTQFKVNVHCHSLQNKVLTAPWLYLGTTYPIGDVVYRDGAVQIADGTYDNTHYEDSASWADPDGAVMFLACTTNCTIYGSDGGDYIKEKIEDYADLDFDAISIADHSGTNYPEFGVDVNIPWETWHVDITTAGILPIHGKELSNGMHRVNIFSDYVLSESDIEDDINNIGDNGGLVHIAHPGRYWLQSGYGDQTPEWYAALFSEYPNIYALEICNANCERYPRDRVLWDLILSITMPDNFVFGTGADDSHGMSSNGRSFQMVLAEELRTSKLRAGMLHGSTYVIHMPLGDDRASHIPEIIAPSINSITIDESTGTITIDGNNYTAINWYSGVELVDTIEVSKLISTGAVFDYASAVSLPYIRAELIGVYGEAYTQPWGLVEITPTSTGDARARDVKVGKTFSNTVGTGLLGTLDATSASRRGGKFPAIYP